MTWPLDILRPGALILLVLLLPVWWWHRRTLAPLRGWRRPAALFARAGVVVLIVFALAEPRWVGQTRDKEVLMLVDRSASAGDRAADDAAAFAEAADFAGARVGWVAFGGEARLAEDPEAFEEMDPAEWDPASTDLAKALALASASFQPGRVRTVVLFSDGVDTTGRESSRANEQGGELLERLAARNIRLHAVPSVPPERPEVLVREVRVPPEVRSEEPVAIEATIQANAPGLAEVSLFRNGVRIAKKAVNLAAGANPVRFDDRTGSDKLMLYEVAVRSQADTLAENNQLGAAAISAGTSRVLLLSDRPESARYLEWALRQEGVELSVRPAEGTPTEMSDLRNFDSVIIDNVPASALSKQQMELLHAFVRDFGGGLIMLGGDEAFGLGGYFRTPVEDILPVQCDFQKEEETPSLALALVIDRSGSMSGESIELAKAAANASVQLLSARDYVAVIAFDHETYPVVPLQSAGNAAGIASEIAAIAAGGGTSMAPAMEEALRQLVTSPAKLKHVILLTDGHSEPGPFLELASEMARNGITVSSVAVGGADTELLAQIAAQGNGRYYETNDWNSVPQIFTKETMTASKSAIQEFPFLAVPVRAADFLEGVPWDAAPFLLGYVRTRAKPTSEIWMTTERGDPLLATWRFGLGSTAAFTSDARNRWAVEWLRWPGYGKFWGQLLRHLARPTSLGLSEIALEQGPASTTLTLDSLDPERGFPKGVEGSVRLADPRGGIESVPLEQTMPGRWTAELPTPGRGIFSGQIVLEKDGEPFDSRFFTVSRGFPAEFRLDPPDERVLGELSEGTGGVVKPDPATIFLEDARTAPVEHELWPWLALLSLLAFVADVAVRRWPEGPSPNTP